MYALEKLDWESVHVHGLEGDTLSEHGKHGKKEFFNNVLLFSGLSSTLAIYLILAIDILL